MKTMLSFAAAGPQHNVLLGLIPAVDRARIERHVETVELRCREAVAEGELQYDYVHFPTTAVLSSTILYRSGVQIETALVGREGMLGAGVVLGTNASTTLTIVLAPGAAIRVPVGVLQREVDRCEATSRILRGYVHTLMAQTSITCACNAAHQIGQRLCRWLLLYHDRSVGDELEITHELISQMLGVQRTGVTVALGELEERSFIRRRRGRLVVTSREGLESASCECYAMIVGEYDRLMKLAYENAP